MKTQRLLLLTLVGLFSLVSPGYAEETLNQENRSEASFEKIYISPDCIFIYPEGIFYLNEAGDVAPARLVASDAAGLYVVAKYYRCPACGRVNRDNICIYPRCALYGQ